MPVPAGKPPFGAAARHPLLPALLACCVRVEPGLLRALRLLDADSAAEPGLEAIVWSYASALAAGSRFCELTPACVADYRDRFAEQAAARQRRAKNSSRGPARRATGSRVLAPPRPRGSATPPATRTISSIATAATTRGSTRTPGCWRRSGRWPALTIEGGVFCSLRGDAGWRRRWIEPRTEPLTLPIADAAKLAAIAIENGRRHYGLARLHRPPWSKELARDRHGLYLDVELAGVVQHFRWLDPGEFWMGSPEDEPERRENQGPCHRVRLSAGFWLAHTACTQALWAAVMGGKNPNRFRDDARNPVEKVSCDDVSAFLHRLVPLLPGVAADLPTEAEWEYASRAGSETRFHFGATITPQQANYNAKHLYDRWKKGKSRRKTVPVKSFAPNDWGLYEMHGNVWEWCADGLRDYAGEMVEDPRGAEVRAPPGRARWLVGQRGQGASLRISRHGAPRHVLRESPRPGVSLCPEVHPPATDFGCVLHCRGRRRCAALLLSIGAASIPPSPAHAVLPMRPAISSCCTRAWSERNS